MAVLIREHTSYQKKLKNESKQFQTLSAQMRQNGILSLSLFVGCFFVGLLWHWVGYFGMFFGVLLFFIHAKKRKRAQNNIYRLQRRIEGVKIVTERILTLLSDEYFLLNDITLPYFRRKIHIDHMIVGPQGILIMETNNWSADIFEMHGKWRIKTAYWDVFKKYNPIKQSRYHDKVIKVMMEKYSDIPLRIHEKLHTQKVIVFTNPGSSIRTNSKENHYLLLLDDWIDFLAFYQRRHALLIKDEINYLSNFFKYLHYRGEQAVKDMEIHYQYEDDRN